MSSTCAVHPEAVATFTCVRCGAFGCARCAATEGLCEACELRREEVLGFDVSAGGLIGDSFRLVTRFIAMAVLLAVLETAASSLLVLAGAILPAANSVVVSIAGVVVSLVALVAFKTIIQASWISVLVDAAHGQSSSLKGALLAALPVALPLFLCNLLAGLAVMLGGLMLILPGIIVALGLCMAAPAVVASRRGPVDALGASWSASEGHRVDLALALLATSALAWVITFGVDFGLGVMVSLVPKLGPLSKPVSSVVNTIAAAPVVTVPVLAWLRLSRELRG